MRFLANLIWLVCGGFVSALTYFTGSLALAITIIGLPLAWQTFRLGLLTLWPFGAEIKEGKSPSGCLNLVFNVVWLIFGGFWAALSHLFFGILLCLSIIGIPWGKQHFKLASLALSPFGRDIKRG